MDNSLPHHKALKNLENAAPPPLIKWNFCYNQRRMKLTALSAFVETASLRHFLSQLKSL